ncbi:hypothetical protein RDWZM_002838 [Blomia tropicalis]|uniref:Uncharacterized protein n=1 Tax=Blomia tropicalis TaxID=40697 RepID=A0A9Q0MFP8_BLOTA|nr:hypothetical protein RDWZM_002838 [Blomia tropicalis]
MKSLGFISVLLFIILSSTSSSEFINDDDLTLKFNQFKIDYSRVYENELDEIERKQIFKRNLEFIRQHNLEASLGEHSYLVGVNQFADLTNEEFRRKFIVNKKSFEHFSLNLHTDNSVESVPTSIDWVAKGVVSPVIDQGECGSSWAIPISGTIESRNAIKTGKFVQLSIEQIYDCCSTDGHGCDGGLFDDAYKCIIKMHGLDTASSYPFHYGDGTCRFNPKTVGAKIRSYSYVKTGDENALQNAVANGPVAAAIDASQKSFQFYMSGVYDEPACTNNVDHGILIVGYGTQRIGNQYWKVKNSWGSSWGMNGYILMSRNKSDQCGIAEMASYPIF